MFGDTPKPCTDCQGWSPRKEVVVEVRDLDWKEYICVECGAKNDGPSYVAYDGQKIRENTNA